jgi:F-type H+-transporting ATPase subunit b
MGRLAPLFSQIKLLALAAVLVLAASMAMAETASEHGTATTGQAATSEEPGPAGGPGVAGFEEGVHEAEHGGGLPQLDALTFPSQIFWLIVCFAVLYYLLSKRALPRVGDILEARQERIAADLDRAATLRGEAEEALRQHQAVVAEAQAKAAAAIKATQDRLAAEAVQRQAQVDGELQQKLSEAEARIGAAKDAALGQIQNVATEVAQAAVRRLAGLDLPAADVKAAVDQVLREAA